MATQRISASVLHPLKEALTQVFWYKKDLRAFLSACIPSATGLVAQLDWTDYKRNVVSQLVDTLAAHQEKYLDSLLDLLLAVSEITDPAHLRKVDDGERKYKDAVEALTVLRKQVEPYRKWRTEQEDSSRRQREEQARAQLQRAIREKLDELRSLLYAITTEPPQQRGYSLEKLLNRLLALYDIDAKSPFRVVGEQIDGAFTFDNTEFLFEARWRSEKAAVADFDSFVGKISRKLDNTLGLFLSVNGFQDSAIETFSQKRPHFFLMDGTDLSAVLEDRISLPELLTRKRQHAARTGEVFISAYAVIG